MWLLTTVGDFYVLGFAVSTIIWQSEESKLWAVMWILLINLLGSPFCMLYLLLRVGKHGLAGIQLKESASAQVYDRFA